MSTKFCVYKDCENYTINGIPTGNFTLFQFPKDSERRKKWFQLGQVPATVSANSLLMCSKHFDRKFMSINQRRTVLVGAAVPYAYKVNDLVQVGDEEYVILNEDETNTDEYQQCETSEVTKNEEYRVESTMEEELEDSSIQGHRATGTNNNDGKDSHMIEIEEEHITTLPISQDVRVVFADEEDLQTKKRKKQHVIGSSKNIEFSYKHKNFEKPGSSSTVIFDEQDLIDKEKVTTFIFKEEEYVQMSKEHYIQEKVELLEKINKYENFIKSFQQKVNEFDFN